MDGYFSTLARVWEASGESRSDTPTKSSLSEARSKVSWKFFEDIFRSDLRKKDKTRKTFKGFYIYAVDGDQLELPASKDIIENGFRGYPFSKEMETHYPKMYSVHALDVLSGVIREFEFSSYNSEAVLAHRIIDRMEHNSITIYDRFYCGHPIFSSHIKNNNYFIARARSTGIGASEQVTKFIRSKKATDVVRWRPRRGLRTKEKDIFVRLVKIKNPRTKENLIFVTNVPEETLKNEEIAKLYQRRWEIETSFRDLTCTLKMNQWHSQKLNGILQEVFALLWLVNNVKRLVSDFTPTADNELLNTKYKKSNFKLCMKLVVDHLELLVKRKWRQLTNLLKHWIIRSQEKRKHLARSYPRVVKHRGREYPHANTVKRRP